VLDGSSARGPVARSFALGVFTGAVLIAAPLAAITLTPGEAQKKVTQKATASTASLDTSKPYYAEPEIPTDLGSIIADGVSTSVQTAVAAVTPVHVVSPDGSSVASENGMTTIRGKDGAAVTIYPADAQGRRKMVARGADGATAVTYVDAREMRGNHAIDDAIGARALGITPEYIGAMRAAAPRLRNLDAGEFNGMRAVGVTPEYVRDLVAAGFPSITSDEIIEARAVGITGGYIRALRAAGVRTSDLDDFVELRSVGVDSEFVARVRRSGTSVSDPDDLVELRSMGGVKPPAPPAPAAPPKPPAHTGRPAASPPDWDPVDPDDG
jgi:hypothetical protein